MIDNDESEKAMEDYTALCTTLKKLRKDAVEGRAQSGIEQIWLEDEEFYEGIDDANRGEKQLKPTSPDGTVRIVSDKKDVSTRSTVFVEITRPYVDAAAARVADMLLPTDDRNFTIEPTPVPDLIQSLTSMDPAPDESGAPVLMQQMDEEGKPVMAPQMGPDGQPVMGEDGNPMMGPVTRHRTAADIARKTIENARKSAEKAQTRVDDWLTECNYIDESRAVIDDAARLGTGIIKGPTPKKIRKRAVVKSLEGIGMVVRESISPCSVRVDVWNFYPDPDCGEDIQRGKYVFEKDEITGRMLANLKGLPGYLDEAIDEILEEGPVNYLDDTPRRGKGDKRNDAELYPIWYFNGYLSAKDLDLLGTEHPEGEQFPVIATMVNDRVIKAALSPLDTGEFPYDVMIWQRRAGSWAGKGVGRQMRTEQRGVNAAVRNLMDNAGLSSGPQIVFDRSKIVPANGVWEIVPRKLWYTVDGETVDDVRKAFTIITIQSLQAELMAIIEFWLKRAEDVTGLPMLLQGQLGKAPDTVGGMTMLNNNASSVLRRIARYYDARITTRHVGRYYEWLLMHGTDPEEKGDFTIRARGSSALVERDAQNQFLMQSVGLSLNPIYKLDPQKIMAKILKSQRISAEDVEMEDEQWQQAMKNVGQNPAAAIAQIREQGAAQRQTEKLGFEAQQNDMDRALTQWIKQVEATLDQLAIAEDKEDGLRDAKVALARDTMKLRTQIQLSPGRQVASPAMEPAGQARPGMAFSQ